MHHSLMLNMAVQCATQVEQACDWVSPKCFRTVLQAFRGFDMETRDDAIALLLSRLADEIRVRDERDSN